MEKSKKTTILIHALDAHENQLVEQFDNLLHAQLSPVLRDSVFIKSIRKRNPDIVLAICDGQCSLPKCVAKIKFLHAWSYLPSIIARPLRHDDDGTNPGTFLIARSARVEGETAALNEFTTHLGRASFIACSPAWPALPSGALYKVARVQKIILEQDVGALTESILARAAGWSASWLSSRFHHFAGINLEQFIIKMRMCKALWQVLSSDKSIKDIAYNFDSNDPDYFSKSFKAHFGCSPGLLRRKHDWKQKSAEHKKSPCHLK